MINISGGGDKFCNSFDILSFQAELKRINNFLYQHMEIYFGVIKNKDAYV